MNIHYPRVLFFSLTSDESPVIDNVVSSGGHPPKEHTTTFGHPKFSWNWLLPTRTRLLLKVLGTDQSATFDAVFFPDDVVCRYPTAAVAAAL